MIEQGTRLILMRHCETSWNADKRLQGQVDIPLNENGKTQACELSFALSKDRFHAIYASPLKRAYYTAFIIAFHHDVEVVTDPDLQEGAYGSAEGMLIEEYHTHYQAALEAYDRLPRLEKLRQTVVPDAESRERIVERAERALLRIAANHPGQRVLVVTHGGVLRSLLMHASEEFTTPPFVHNGDQVHFHSDGKALTFQQIVPRNAMVTQTT